MIMRRASLNLKAILRSILALSCLALPSSAGLLTAPGGEPRIALGGGGRESDPSAAVVVVERGWEVTSGVIRSYLDSNGGTDATGRRGAFHIQGWRWHTQSLVRETDRLHRLASRTNVDSAAKLKEASDYVVGFNLRGLHKIEAGLFFPWMREKLTSSAPRGELRAAFASVMDQLEDDRRMVEELGDSISRNLAVACDPTAPEPMRATAIDAVADQSHRLHLCARNMMEIEDAYLVPAVAELVDEDEQRALNGRVLRNLGLLDSRLHLVAMHEAVWETNDPAERELFRQAIPSVTQMLIPRWKRKLYEPKTYMLE